MKTNKMLIAIIGMMAWLATSQLNAQTAPTANGGGSPVDPWGISATVPDLPISMDDIQVAAWEAVAQISMNCWASSSVRATNDNSSILIPYSPLGGVNVNNVFTIIMRQRLYLNILYQGDSVGLGTGLYDKGGNPLLYSECPPQKIGPYGGLVCQDNKFGSLRYRAD